MTYIQPNKNNNKVNFLISISIIFSVSLAVWSVFLYNQTVNLRYEITDYEKIVRRAEVENVELKNNLRQIVDSKNLETLAENGNLVLDKNPEYLRMQSLTAR